MISSEIVFYHVVLIAAKSSSNCLCCFRWSLMDPQSFLCRGNRMSDRNFIWLYWMPENFLLMIFFIFNLGKNQIFMGVGKHSYLSICKNTWNIYIGWQWFKVLTYWFTVYNALASVQIIENYFTVKFYFSLPFVDLTYIRRAYGPSEYEKQVWDWTVLEYAKRKHNKNSSQCFLMNKMIIDQMFQIHNN